MDKKYINCSYEEKNKIINRINRIDGQIHGIKKMIESDRYCNELLIELQAVNKSIKSLSSVILENHLYNCVSEELEKGNLEIIDEIINLFKRF